MDTSTKVEQTELFIYDDPSTKITIPRTEWGIDFICRLLDNLRKEGIEILENNPH